MVKKSRLVSFIIITILAYIFNHYYLGISPYVFTGIYLGLWLFIGFIGLYVLKAYKKKKGLPQEEFSYALPDSMAKVMKKVDMRTQYEASILSMFFMMVGLIAFTIYIIFIAEFGLIFKILTGFNSFFGVIFMLSYLITTYQQYVSYMETSKTVQSLLTNQQGGEVLPLDITQSNFPKPVKGGTNKK
jgi:hypothetical protein